jgi:1A family penicillin-binding protein
MTNKDLRRRTYGYHKKESHRPTTYFGTAGGTEKRETKQQSSLFSQNWLKWLLLPIALLSWLLRMLWKGWKKRPKLPKKLKKRLKAKAGWVILTVIVLGFLSTTIIIAWASKDLPDPDKITDRKIAQSTKIYDRTGEHILYEVFADQKRTMVSLEEIPQNLVNGVIATEDNEFYEHKGIKVRSFVRAAVYAIFTSKRAGGTSTLTQQLVKNAILTNERSYVRKLKEVILSIRLEQKYSKDQILQIYFNEIPYGSTNYGVQSAAHSYFGKDVSELDLQESATLAGLPKAPTYYLNNTEALKQRRDFVLRRMFEEEYITEEEKNEAQAKPITLEKRFGEIKAPHFVLYVRQQLVDMYGEQAVDSGGLKVYTTLDWRMQQAAETAVSSSVATYFEEAEADNAALVAMNPRTGQILAMVGSKDFYDEEIDGQFNVATLGRRQPGSSFKPIVYTAAFEKGYTPETVLFDVKTNFAAAGDDYEPLNYDLKERGPVTMRQAVQGSLNIPAVKTLYLVGAEKGVEFAEKLGYTTLSEGEFGLSLVLGGGEVKLLEHVNSYGVFANEGVFQKHESILKVEDNKGDILYEWQKKKGERAIEEEIAATISNVLSDDEARAYAFGAGGVLTLPERPVAAKTGTTNAYVDAWTVGYTPSLVAGVWAGNTDNTPMKRGYGGSKVAAPIWKAFMIEALKDMPVEAFPEVPENDAKKPILLGSQGGGVTLPIDKITGKIATTSTPKQYIVERTYIPAHNILHYVYKDDPRGAVPKDPSKDSQYQIWEEAIADWVVREKEANPDWDISFEEPPTEYDDLHSIELVPTLEIMYPAASSTLHSRQIDTDIRVSAPRGVAKVIYKIDEKYLGAVKTHPFNLNYYARDFDSGWHTLTVIVEDDIGNRLEKVIPFNMDVENEPASIYFSQKNVTLKQSDFPRTFFMEHFKIDEVKALAIYKSKNGNNELIASVDDFSDLFNNQVTFKWDEKISKGNHELIAEIRLKDNSVRESGRLKVVVE